MGLGEPKPCKVPVIRDLQVLLTEDILHHLGNPDILSVLVYEVAQDLRSPPFPVLSFQASGSRSSEGFSQAQGASTLRIC